MIIDGNGFLKCARFGVDNHPPGCQPTNSTTQAKYLGVQQTVEECAQACAAFRYRDVFPCRSYTFFLTTYGNTSKQKGWRSLCYGRIDDVFFGATRPGDGAVTSGINLVPDCTTAMQCELNGRCSAQGKCECAQGWTGRFCQTLDLRPARLGNGYHRLNTSSWGGSIIPPDVSGLDKYQLIVAEFEKGCG